MLLTGTTNNDLEDFVPGRRDSQTIWPSGRFQALNMLPSDDSVITSERQIKNPIYHHSNTVLCTSLTMLYTLRKDELTFAEGNINVVDNIIRSQNMSPNCIYI